MHIGARSAHSTLRSLVTVLALAALMLAAAGCAKLQARDQLNKGVKAYKANKFEQAIEHFKNAIQLDQKLDIAKLYLATACAAQYVPGGENEENLRNANCAIEQFKKVMEAETTSRSNRMLSLKGLGSLYMNMKKFDEANGFFRKATELDPNDQYNFYSIAVIDWTQAFTARIALRTELGVKPDEPIKDKKACQGLKEKSSEKVEEGMKMLQRSIEIQKDYSDAMAYLNLLYRERADIQCDDPEARKADLALADEWVEKAKATMQAKLEKAKEQHGIVMPEKPTQ